MPGGVRRGAGGETNIGAEGLVAAAFTHRTSRAGDPQLHTHLLVANVAKGVDGIWSAPSSRLLYNHSRTAGFLYQSALRAGLARALGVRFGEVSRGMAELDGVPKSLLRAFSTRRREIEHQMAATGATSARSGEVATLTTRSAKDASAASATTVSLRQRWLAQVGGLGLAPKGEGGPLDHLVGATAWRPPSTSEVDQLLDRLAGPDGLTAGHSAFERHDVARLVAEALFGGFPGGRRRGAGRSVPQARPTSSPWRVWVGEARSVTPRSRCWESNAPSSNPPAGRAKGVGGLPIERTWSRPSTTSACSPTSRPRWWRCLTSSGSGVEVVVGKAGAGKTLALAAARMSWESSGFRVLGTALSARAARGLHDGAGIDSQTLASLLAGIESGRTQLGVSDVVVVDEAGMVGTRALARLIESADDAGAKVVLVGDPRQLPTIEAGGRAGRVDQSGRGDRAHREPAPAVIVGARRPRRLAHGRANVALATYERAGRIHAAPTMAEAQTALVQQMGRVVLSGRRRRDARRQPPRRGKPQRAGSCRTAPLGTPRCTTCSRPMVLGSPPGTR